MWLWGVQVGYDIEQQAVEASRANAQLNAVTGTCTFHLCSEQGLDPDSIPQRLFDVCIANIFQGDLLALRETFTGLVRPGGRIVMSGVLEGAQVLCNPCRYAVNVPGAPPRSCAPHAGGERVLKPVSRLASVHAHLRAAASAGRGGGSGVRAVLLVCLVTEPRRLGDRGSGAQVGWWEMHPECEAQRWTAVMWLPCRWQGSLRKAVQRMWSFAALSVWIVWMMLMWPLELWPQEMLGSRCQDMIESVTALLCRQSGSFYRRFEHHASTRLPKGTVTKLQSSQSVALKSTGGNILVHVHSNSRLVQW